MANPIIDYMQNKSSKIAISFRLVMVGFNLLALLGGIINIIHPMPYLLWNLFGYVILVTLVGNIVLAYIGGVYRYLDYCYLLMHIVCMLFIPIMNTLASSNPQNKTSQSVFALVLYHAIFLFGAAIAGLRLGNEWKNNRADSEDITKVRSSKFKNVMRWIAVALLILCLLFGFYLSYIILGKNTGHMIEVFIPEYAVFWGFLMIGASVMIIRLRWRLKGSVLNKIVLIIGVLIYVICFVPLASVPLTIRNADIAYREAFGDIYLDNGNIDEQYGFMRTPFSLQNYFLGTRTFDYILKENILYYEGTTGVDSGIKLHFDAYIPLQTNSDDLAAQNSVLIRIHGGSWTMGDKGSSNYAEINKHFVNRGYAVFDIQYGLSNQNPSFASAVVPTSVKGDLTKCSCIIWKGLCISTGNGRHCCPFTTAL